jgi:hypothetical protein
MAGCCTAVVASYSSNKVRLECRLQHSHCAVQVQGLDAALRALQHATPADSFDNSQQQQAQASEPEQQQQQEGPSALQLPAPPEAGKGSAAKQQEPPGKQATVQQVEPASPGSSDTATADNQQEASPTQQPSHSASLAAAVMQPSSPAGRLDSGGAHALAQQQQQCLCSKLLCGGLHTSLGSNLALGLPLQQLQDNSLFVEQLVSGCKGSVLSGVCWPFCCMMLCQHNHRPVLIYHCRLQARTG